MMQIYEIPISDLMRFKFFRIGKELDLWKTYLGTFLCQNAILVVESLDRANTLVFQKVL